MAEPVYSDQLSLNVNRYGAALGFGSSVTNKTVAVVHLSPEVAKQLALWLHVNLKKYERDIRPIPFDEKTAEELGIALEDW